MGVKIEFTKLALFDIIKIKKWYSGKSENLHLRFLTHLEREIEKVKNSPLMFQVVRQGTRKFSVNKFPYNVYYLVEKERIVIVGLIHNKRSNAFIKKKLKK
ncbi:MAG: type II toxin-antitoxin system RelE/ParE family toxin [Bacteroidia bacterium]|nr:type II toxin-antitoxin system RelE/ParE family toxin [Bacteroidia bacterium]